MHDQYCYKKPFLKQVIARIDFASPLNKLEKGVPNNILSAIVKEFPIVEPPAEIMSHEVSIEGSGSIQAKQTTNKQWNYFGINREKTLVLTSEYLMIVYHVYSTYDAAKSNIESILLSISKEIPGTMVSRFGLRYINQIELTVEDPTKWNEYITPSLWAGRGFFDENDPISRLVGISEIQYEDVFLRFQYGIPNPDYPAIVRRPLFILDLDASVMQAHELSEVVINMDLAHKRIQNIFERSITDALREKMNATPIQ